VHARGSRQKGCADRRRSYDERSLIYDA